MTSRCVFEDVVHAMRAREGFRGWTGRVVYQAKKGPTQYPLAGESDGNTAAQDLRRLVVKNTLEHVIVSGH